VLDTLADKEPKLSPKATAQAGGTDGPALHPSQEDLKAYAYGRLASARLDYCQAHLDTCEDCRIELEDIRTCSNEMPSLARPEVPSAKSLRRKRGLAVPVMGSAALLVAVAVATALWVRHGDARADKSAPVVAAVTGSAVAEHSVAGPARGESAVAAVPSAHAIAATPPPVAHSAIASAADAHAVATSPIPQSAGVQGTGAPSRAALSPAARSEVAVAPTAQSASVQGTGAPSRAALAPVARSEVAVAPTAQSATAAPPVGRDAAAPPPVAPGMFARITAAISRVVHGSAAPAQVAPTQVAQAPAAGTAVPASPAAGARPGTPQLADEIAALPDDVRSAVSATIQHGKLEFPTNVGRSRRHTPSHAGVPAANTGFALLGPFGEATSDTRPEFSWQPLPGAIRYSVAIVDAALHPVQHSGVLRKTVWRPKHPLRPGRTYLWQVTATLPGGSRVVASEPAPSEAVLRIVPVKLTDEMARFRKDHQDSHLVLGALYAQAGMLTESEDELKKVPPSDSSYKTARTLLDSLSSTGASPQ